MTSSTDTVRRLAEMTDAAAFERIATAVLRAADPSIYGNMAHPGVQPGGKTVKAPFDNVGWVNSPDGRRRLVCAAHTTVQRDLAGKWMQDPAKAKARKSGGKPTKPAGDVIKGLAEIRILRETNPGLAVTFALTTNTDPALDLRVAVEEMAATAEVDLDVWAISRIAHFLDTDPTGQLIRRTHLGTQVQLLSRALLLEMGERSIRDHVLDDVLRESIHRDHFPLGRADSLVVGDSGMGKTTACAAALLAHIEGGAPAIVIKVEFVEVAPTIEVALESELRRQHPSLEPGSGERAISLCTSDEPLLILFEDINRSISPSILLNKILSWAQSGKPGEKDGRCWRTVCPIWPRYLNAIEDQLRRLKGVTVLRVGKYSEAEAIRAVTKRAALSGLTIDRGRATSIASRLGLDPLLIGLHDLRCEAPTIDVIGSYIDERMGIVANDVQRAKSEINEAVHHLLREALQRRRLNPLWSEIRSWIHDKDTVALLRGVTREGSVIRLSTVGTDEALEFRHDRVMHCLLSMSLVEVLRNAPHPDYITDPFFAEAVAGGAVQATLPLHDVLSLMEASPAIGAHALKLSSEQRVGYADIASVAVSTWLHRQETAAETMASRRFAIARILAETTSKHVQPLVSCFPNGDYQWWEALWAAQFRNGDLRPGLVLLSRHELGVNIAGRQSLLSLVKQSYGPRLVSALSEVLGRTDLTQHGMRTGALRLAGYIGDSTLAPRIRVCWEQDGSAERDLRSYLFAAARCCGDEADATLGPVCDAWESLPDEHDPTHLTPAENLAADGVDWEFGRYVPQCSIRYFIARANTSDKLRWPITYMFRTLDHPDALEYVVRYAASTSIIGAHILKSHWSDNFREPAREMSPESKNRLLQIALDEHEPADVRKQAFSFWEQPIAADDLARARRIPPEHLLFERALWARARRGDQSVIPQVLLKMPEDPKHWLRIGRYVWSEGMTKALESVMKTLAESTDKELSDLEYAVADALMEVESAQRLSMLCARWEHLKAKPLMVQAALLSTGPGAAELARDAFAAAAEPRSLLRHFASNVVFMSGKKRKLSTREQMHNLLPYLTLFSDEEVVYLWDACGRHGWRDFQRQYLEARIRAIPKRTVRMPDEPVDTSHLDEALSPNGYRVVHVRHWIEQTVRAGASREKALEALLLWLRENNHERAFHIAADIVRRECTRSEFLLFAATAKEQSNASDLIDAVRFDVWDRSLV